MGKVSEVLDRAASAIAAKALPEEEQEFRDRAFGKPPAEIDQRQFEKLCGMQATQREIMAWFDVTDKTLNHWCWRTYGESFLDVYDTKREAGKISLRRNQWRLSEHNPTMAIWLGKQYLDQHDERDLRWQGSATVQIIDDIPKQAEPQSQQAVQLTQEQISQMVQDANNAGTTH